MPRDAERLRPRLGYMTQKFSLWDDLTVVENLRFMSQVYDLAPARRRERIDAVVQEYWLERQLGQRAGTLSGGQRQRLALAAATLHEPELLLLDEPTSAVDPQSRRDFWESLFTLVARGVTILVSTHYMDEAERCHELAILADGKLVAKGSPKRLMGEIPAAVVEIEAEDTVGARQALVADEAVLSVAQLGTRLHVLLRPDIEAPSERCAERLRGAGVAGQATRVSASLEDVFVAATGFRRTSHVAANGG
jgi:ABC-2 type transport system ATP-binding protein